MIIQNANRRRRHLASILKLKLNFPYSMVLSQENLVMVRHYSFIDFAKYGSPWHPDWFNVVRDPIDKIVSWFYYWRAAWNVVARIKTFPREPLPDVEFLRKDFDTCVLTGEST